MAPFIFWLNLALWAGLMLVIHSKPRQPGSRHGIERYPDAFWNWPDRR